MFKKILIANRGEIAVRVMRTARELGIRTVAVYSDADRCACHVELANEAVYLGEAPATASYLNIGKLLAAAKSTGAEAIHPGYGFLSENPLFSQAVTDAGLVFVGPPAGAMKLLGNKIESRVLAQREGVPVTPGATFEQPTAEVVRRAAEQIGYPVLIKAAAGGGGKGMRVVPNAEELPLALEGAMREAGSAFGDSTVYLEKYLTRPRHIEFQVFCDRHGHAVHLGERECSIQRRHQKIVEESPSVALTPALRKQMGEAAVKVVKAAGYENAGTVEMLLDGDQFYFLEVNARLQVEHPVTEMVTGEDLVHWQFLVASGARLPKTQAEILPRGHAIECRIYAEDPANSFLPSSGTVLALDEPRIPGVRIDSGIREGSEVSVFYDPILSKVIVHAATRDQAISRMREALNRYVLLGVANPLEYLQSVLAHPAFQRGELSTHFISDHLSAWKPTPAAEPELAAALAAALLYRAPVANSAATSAPQSDTPWRTLGGWHIAAGGGR
ncbi:ATP-grasp domain-containing protein [candidate division KSB1 bacterium]|nr:ATP-grasp domain-containing protein [candidate division KSB1 bacterium]